MRGSHLLKTQNVWPVVALILLPYDISRNYPHFQNAVLRIKWWNWKATSIYQIESIVNFLPNKITGELKTPPLWTRDSHWEDDRPSKLSMRVLSRFVSYCVILKRAMNNSWFYNDVTTKIQTKNLSLLLSFYYHVVLQHVKTFIQTNVRFKTVLHFATHRRLNFQALAWHGIKLTARKALMWVKNITDFGRFRYPNIPCLRINITLIFMSSSSEQLTH